jgi:hypothetical protein
MEIKRLPNRFDEMTASVRLKFGVAYHWSVDQYEYAIDVRLIRSLIFTTP